MLVFSTARCLNHDSKAEQYRPQHGEGKLVVKGKVSKRQARASTSKRWARRNVGGWRLTLISALLSEKTAVTPKRIRIYGRTPVWQLVPLWQWCGRLAVAEYLYELEPYGHYD